MELQLHAGVFPRTHGATGRNTSENQETRARPPGGPLFSRPCSFGERGRDLSSLGRFVLSSTGRGWGNAAPATRPSPTRQVAPLPDCLRGAQGLFLTQSSQSPRSTCDGTVVCIAAFMGFLSCLASETNNRKQSAESNPGFPFTQGCHSFSAPKWRHLIQTRSGKETHENAN